MRIAVSFAAVAVSLALVWLAADRHKQACVNRGWTACSVLPWDDGHSRPATVVELPRCTSFQRQQNEVRMALDGSKQYECR